MYLHIGVIVSTTFVWINYYSITIHAERDLRWRMASSMRPSSLNSFLSRLSKMVNNIPNQKLSSSHIITVYVWYSSKALHYPFSPSHHRKLPLFQSHSTLETQMKCFPSSSVTHCIGVNRMCSSFVSKWISQAFCLNCPQCDSSKHVTKYCVFLYFCSTKPSKWNLFQKYWKVSA